VTPPELFALAGVALFVAGLDGLIRRAHLLRRILALNIMSSGVFLVIAGLAKRGADGMPDPVPHALVITGIVVSVAVTGLALALMLRVAAATGSAELPDVRPE